MERYTEFIGQKAHIKMSIFYNLIYKFNTTTIKILSSFSVEISKPILNLLWKRKGSSIRKIILKRNNKVEELLLPNFKAYYKATIIKIA